MDLTRWPADSWDAVAVESDTVVIAHGTSDHGHWFFYRSKNDAASTREYGWEPPGRATELGAAAMGGVAWFAFGEEEGRRLWLLRVFADDRAPSVTAIVLPWDVAAWDVTVSLVIGEATISVVFTNSSGAPAVFRADAWTGELHVCGQGECDAARALPPSVENLGLGRRLVDVALAPAGGLALGRWVGDDGAGLVTWADAADPTPRFYSLPPDADMGSCAPGWTPGRTRAAERSLGGPSWLLIGAGRSGALDIVVGELGFAGFLPKKLPLVEFWRADAGEILAFDQTGALAWEVCVPLGGRVVTASRNPVRVDDGDGVAISWLGSGGVSQIRVATDGSREVMADELLWRRWSPPLPATGNNFVWTGPGRALVWWPTKDKAGAWMHFAWMEAPGPSSP